MAFNPIKGKVARILNSREIVINKGASDGVKLGMYFDILDQKGEDILDPDTGQILGSIKRPKVRVKIINVEDRLSLASTYKKQRVNIGGFGLGSLQSFSQALTPPKYIDKVETLKTTESTWEDLDEQDSYIKIGDPVIQILQDED